MKRRDFLHPRRLAQTAGQILGAFDKPAASPRANDGLTLLRFARRAMATGFEIALPLGTPSAAQAAEEALEQIDELEAQLTVYRDTSEISRINRHAAIAPLPIETRLFELLALAARIHADTDGAYDIAVGALIKAWGFYRRAGRVPSESERADALTRCGMRQIALDAQKQTIRFLTPGIEINLGSIGKGYSLDRIAEGLRADWNIHSGLLHGGTSSVCALGAPPGQPAGWTVGLGHPWNFQQRLGVVRLRDRALGTSSATFQHVEHQGKKLGHILDPRTGWPAEGMASATVIAPTAAEADALATAFFVLGVEPARIYCQKRPEIGAVLLPVGEGAMPVVVGNVDFCLARAR
jgi:thiamine biosynthesis lipoprotein